MHIRNGVPDARPAAPEVEGAAINFIQAVTRINSNRDLTQAFVYRVSAANPGAYTIPSITLTSRGKSLPTPPVTFQVHSLDSLQSISTGENSPPLKIGWFPAKTTLFVGEVTPISLKVYAPEALRITSFGLPDPKKENCLAWRFSLPNRRDITTTLFDGVRHRIATYSTTLSGIQPGTATFGPTTLRLISRQRVLDPRFGTRLVDQPLNPTLPAVNFNILALPEGAPSSFRGAVGNFQLSATTQKTTLKQSESTEVLLSIAGTGNLPTIEPPSLSGNDWKVIDTSKITRGEERRFTSGTVRFRQILRPEPNSTPNTQHSTLNIPPYTFTFFDPEKKSYHTLTTPPIPVTVIPESSTPNKKPHNNTNITGPSKMQDILGFIQNPDLSHSKLNTQHSKLWHVVPVTLIALIIAHALYKRRQKRIALRPDLPEKKQALRKLTESPDTRTFYRRAGRIIDQWHTPKDELNKILAERDAICFLPEDSPAEEISPTRRQEIIDILKRSTKLTLILCSILISLALTNPCIAGEKSTITSAQSAWKTGNYQQALDIYQQAYPEPNNTPADILYNIGNCHHRLDQPGHAALAWRRALHQDPSHARARQNLLYTQLTKGSSTIPLKPWQLPIATLHHQTYLNILYACGWTILISTIVMLIHLRDKKIITITVIITILSGIGVLASGTAAIFHPDSPRTAPIEKQAILLEKTTLYPEAHRTPSTLEDPALHVGEHSKLNTQNSKLAPASLVIITAQRGPWSHITTFDDQQGWVESKFLGKIISN